MTTTANLVSNQGLPKVMDMQCQTEGVLDTLARYTYLYGGSAASKTEEDSKPASSNAAHDSEAIAVLQSSSHGIGDLGQQFVDLRRALGLVVAETEREAVELKERLTMLERDIEGYKSIAASRTSQVKDLEQKLRNSKDENNGLRGNIVEGEKALAAKEQELKSLYHKLKDTNLLRSGNEGDLKRLASESADYKQRAWEAEERLRGSTQNAQQWKHEAERRRKECQSLMEQVDELKHQVEEFSKEIENTKISFAQQTDEAVKAKTEHTHKQINELKLENHRLKETLEQSENNLALAHRKLTASSTQSSKPQQPQSISMNTPNDVQVMPSSEHVVVGENGILQPADSDWQSGIRAGTAEHIPTAQNGSEFSNENFQRQIATAPAPDRAILVSQAAFESTSLNTRGNLSGHKTEDPNVKELQKQIKVLELKEEEAVEQCQAAEKQCLVLTNDIKILEEQLLAARATASAKADSDQNYAAEKMKTHDLSQTVDELMAQVKDLQEGIASKERERKASKEALESVHELLDQHRTSAAAADSVKKEAESWRREAERLQKELDKLNRDLSHRISLNQDLEVAISDSQRRLESTQAELRGVQELCEALATQKEECERSIDDLSVEISTMKSRLKSKEQVNDDLREKLANAEEDCESLKHRSTMKIQDLETQLKEETRRANDMMMEADKSMMYGNAQGEALKKRRMHDEDNIRRLDTEVQRLKRDATLVDKRHRTEALDMRMQLREAQLEVQRLRDERELFRNRVDKSRSDLGKVGALHREERDKLEHEIRTLKSEIQSLNRKLMVFEGKAKAGLAFQRMIEDLERKLETVRSEKIAAQASLTEASRQYGTEVAHRKLHEGHMMDELNALLRSNRQLRYEREDAVKESKKSQRESAQAVAAFQAEQKRVEDLKLETVATQHQLRQENREIESETVKLQVRISVLETELEEAKQESKTILAHLDRPSPAAEAEMQRVKGIHAAKEKNLLRKIEDLTAKVESSKHFKQRCERLEFDTSMLQKQLAEEKSNAYRQVTEIKEKHEEGMQQYDNVVSTVKQLREEANELAERLQARDNTLAKLQAELEHEKQHKNILDSQVEAARSGKTSMLRRYDTMRQDLMDATARLEAMHSVFEVSLRVLPGTTIRPASSSEFELSPRARQTKWASLSGFEETSFEFALASKKSSTPASLARFQFNRVVAPSRSSVAIQESLEHNIHRLMRGFSSCVMMHSLMDGDRVIPAIADPQQSKTLLKYVTQSERDSNGHVTPSLLQWILEQLWDRTDAEASHTDAVIKVQAAVCTGREWSDALSAGTAAKDRGFPSCIVDLDPDTSAVSFGSAGSMTMRNRLDGSKICSKLLQLMSDNNTAISTMGGIGAFVGGSLCITLAVHTTRKQSEDVFKSSLSLILVDGGAVGVETRQPGTKIYDAMVLQDFVVWMGAGARSSEEAVPARSRGHPVFNLMRSIVQGGGRHQLLLLSPQESAQNIHAGRLRDEFRLWQRLPAVQVQAKGTESQFGTATQALETSIALENSTSLQPKGLPTIGKQAAAVSKAPPAVSTSDKIASGLSNQISAKVAPQPPSAIGEPAKGLTGSGKGASSDEGAYLSDASDMSVTDNNATSLSRQSSSRKLRRKLSRSRSGFIRPKSRDSHSKPLGTMPSPAPPSPETKSTRGGNKATRNYRPAH